MMTYSAAGQRVTCRKCGRTYTCTPADDYYARDGEEVTGPGDGLCFGCLLAANGRDVQTEPVLVLGVDEYGHLHELDPRDGYG
jgi:hypothetical protein